MKSARMKMLPIRKKVRSRGPIKAETLVSNRSPPKGHGEDRPLLDRYPASPARTSPMHARRRSVPVREALSRVRRPLPAAVVGVAPDAGRKTPLSFEIARFTEGKETASPLSGGSVQISGSKKSKCGRR
jgi:hypothetical protein